MELLYQLHVFQRFGERWNRVVMARHGVFAGVVGSEREFEVVGE